MFIKYLDIPLYKLPVQVLLIFLFFLFLAILVLGLRASHLLGRCSTTLVILPALLLIFLFAETFAYILYWF
jgi:hypothetical protein